jgi:transcriptional regulator with XRE-family HTH domain
MINNEHFYCAIDIIEKIEKLRQEKKIPKKEIGKRLGYTVQYYYALYDSYRVLTVKSLKGIAKALDVNVGYLLGSMPISKYEDFEVDYSSIIKNKAKFPKNLATIRSKIKNNTTKNITIKTLLEFEQILKIPAIELIKPPPN